MQVLIAIDVGMQVLLTVDPYCMQVLMAVVGVGMKVLLLIHVACRC